MEESVFTEQQKRRMTKADWQALRNTPRTQPTESRNAPSAHNRKVREVAARAGGCYLIRDKNGPWDDGTNISLVNPESGGKPLMIIGEVAGNYRIKNVQ